MNDDVTTADRRYLKAIWYVTRGRDPATVGAVAQRVQVSHASASTAVSRLVDADLVRRGADGLALTDEGHQLALRQVRRHRLLETFLVEVLDYGWDEVHDEAELLEWTLSDRLEQRIAARLGHPERDPHGDPIPPVNGTHHEERGIPLAGVEPGTQVRIARVSDHDPDLLRFLNEQGLGLGSHVEVGHQDAFGGPLWVTSDQGRHALGAPVVAAIHVTAPTPAEPGNEGVA